MNYTLNLLSALANTSGADIETTVSRVLFLSLIAIAIIALVIKAYSNRDLFTEEDAKEEPVKAQPAPVVTTVQEPTIDDGINDETKAVIMALVSHESGIPLNRLDFKSIKLMEDK